MLVAEGTVKYFDADYDRVSMNGLPKAVVDTLEHINRKIAAHESLEDIMSFLFDAGRRIWPCDRLGLAFLEDDGRRVVQRWTNARYSPVFLAEGYAEDISKSTLKEVISTGRVRLIQDFVRYLNVYPDSTSTTKLVEEGLRSSMTCPLYVEGRPIALLFMSSKSPRAFTEEHVREHLAIAEHLGQAVEKAYKLEQMEQAYNSYMEMLGFVSHELKSPLSSIVTDSRLIVEGYLGDVTEEQKSKISAIEKKADYLLGLIREYLDLARIEGGLLKPRAKKGVDFCKDVVTPAFELVKEELEAKKMKFNCYAGSETAEVEIDPDLIKIVMINLINNAVKYGFRMGEVRVSAKLEGGEFSVSVYNEGFGFPAIQQPYLFRKFSRLKTTATQEVKGTGVGLYTCWRIVRAHGGMIYGESKLGQWARFKFTIPQPLSIAESASE